MSGGPLDGLSPFLESTVRGATPLVLAAIGETLVERAGIINVGIEGCLIAGAFGGLVAAGSGSVALGLAGAVLAGAVLAALFALCVVRLRMDQIITGTALTLLGLGGTGVLYRAWYGAGGAALSVPTAGPVAIPGLAGLPVLGTALFAQPVTTYLAALAVALTWLFLYRTHAGLALRAIGESPEAARSSGVAVVRLQAAAIMVGGGLAGLAGGTLVLAQVGTFAEGMSAGRGFVAIAIVVLGRWHPVGVAVGGLLFGAASATQFLLQSLGLDVPYQLFLAFPYALTLAALAVFRGRGRPPGALGAGPETG